MRHDKTKHALPTLLAVILLAIALVPALNSCGQDEPDMLVGYYLDIKSQVPYKASGEDEEQGTVSSSTVGNVLYVTITRMKRALQEAYPTVGYEGNDAAVISALDAIYRDYKASYGHLERNPICVVKLYRTKMDGTIVKKSRSLKAYQFCALPSDVDLPEL